MLKMKGSLVGILSILSILAVVKCETVCVFDGQEITIPAVVDCVSFFSQAESYRRSWFPWHRFPILSTLWPILRPTTPSPDEDNDDEECPADGIKQISHPDSCEKYILCIGGSAVERRCAPGFHFSREFRSCVSPDIAECEEERKWQCPKEDDLNNLVFLPNKENCSKYYLCFGGDQIPLSCSDGLHWSTEEEACVDKKKANCDFEDEDEDDIEECPDTGVKSISHPDNCEKYVLCVGGTRIKRNCAPGFHFSRKTRTCEVPENAGCEDFGKKLQCPKEDDLDNLVFLPSSESCSKYYICFGGEGFPMTCADGLHWSVDEQSCLDEANAGCKKDEDAEECPESGVKSISHPYNCEKYVLCVGGTRIKRNCAPGLHFSRNLRQCTTPSDAECKDQKFTCPEEDNLDQLVFLPNTEDCSRYYVCFGGEPIPLTCGDGLHWSMEENTCLKESKANCEFGDEDDFEECPEDGIVNISHPNNCEKYILCIGGSRVKRDCAPGFHFSRDFRSCVQPDIANCEV